MKRRLGVLPNLYQAVLHYVLWATHDATLEGTFVMCLKKQLIA